MESELLEYELDEEVMEAVSLSLKYFFSVLKFLSPTNHALFGAVIYQPADCSWTAPVYSSLSRSFRTSLSIHVLDMQATLYTVQ
jgi:hypothetical protein